MSRWIDVEWLMNFFVDIPNNFTLTIGNLRATVNDAPTIEIIRCGECKWFDSGKNDSEIWSMCTRHFGKYIDVNTDDFCSYGCREEE